MIEAEGRGHWVRLRTLLNLRWVAIAGQTGAVLAGRYLFGLDLPLWACLGAIAAPVAVNLVAWRLHPVTKRLSERDAMLSLLFDIVQVGVLLALTGGLTNPFAVLLLAPVTIAASVLELRSTLILASAAMALTSLLLVVHRPLAFRDGTGFSPPELYLFGLWVAITAGIAFMALYTRRIGVETARMAEALAAARLALSREQRLTAIGALSAAAAHELGTPLATIKLIAGELARELRDRPDCAEDLALLREQAERCRAILHDLGAGGRSDRHIRHAPISAVIEEAAAPHRGRGKAIVTRLNGRPIAEAGEAQPLIARRPEIIHGLRNLVQNAVDFASGTIWVDVRERGATLRIAVGDDGPGFKPEMIELLGDPYVTSRGRERARPGDDGEYQGMGLGLFIAKTLLERTGARLVFTNGEALRGEDQPSGAVVAAIWPREAVVARREAARAALGTNPRFEESEI